MTESEFQALSPWVASRFARDQAPEQHERLRALYLDKNGIDIFGAVEEPTRPQKASAVGWWLVGLGAFIALSAFFFPVSVSTAGLYGAPSAVANIDKIALRHMILACGLALFVGGCVLAAGDGIARRLRG